MRRSGAVSRLPSRGLQFAHQQLDEGGLARAVGAEQGDARAGAQHQADIGEQGLVAVAARGLLQPDEGVRAAFRGFDLQLEMAVVDVRRGDAFQPLQRLDAALRLLGLAGLGAEAADEVLEVGDLLLLLRKGLVLLRSALGTGAFEAVVVAGVAVDHLVVHVGDAVDAGVEELSVVRHQQDAAGVAREVLLQPQDGFEVEVVGRLVQQQQVGAAHQGAGQVEAHAPAAGEARHRARQLLGAESQPVEQLRGTGRGGVALDGFETVLCLEPGGIVRLLRQHALQLAQLAVAVEHEFQRRALGVGDFLLHEGQGLALLEGDLAAVGADFAADQAEQGGFAAAVLAHQADALVGEDLQGGVLEEGGSVLEINQILQ